MKRVSIIRLTVVLVVVLGLSFLPFAYVNAEPHQDTVGINDSLSHLKSN